MPTFAIKCLKLFLTLLSIPLIPLLAIIMWQIILPKATVHYSEDGRQEIKFTWNVEDRIDRGRMPPGSLTNDRGVLFPDSEFFMEFSWHNNKKIDGIASASHQSGPEPIYTSTQMEI